MKLLNYSLRIIGFIYFFFNINECDLKKKNLKKMGVGGEKGIACRQHFFSPFVNASDKIP